MATMTVTSDSLRVFGLDRAPAIYRNDLAPMLYEQTIKRGTGRIAAGGAMVVDTTPYTGRSPKDKFVVKDAATENRVAWGKVNEPFDPKRFDALADRVCEHLAKRELWVQDLCAGADRRQQLPIRLVTESPWHALFARNLFLRVEGSALETHKPEFHILHAPSFLAEPAKDGTRSEAFIILNFTRKIVMIGGTQYAGEIKKSIFTVLNYLLPQQGVFPMHCSANIGEAGDVALFFGLSGTGKTTLSADPARPLIGDDEHGWSDDGVFNFEGGCYAKVIRLNARARAGDLRDHTHLRHGPRERRRRRPRRPGPEQRGEDREHARGLPSGTDPQRRARRMRRPSQEYRLSDGGRVRGAASSRRLTPDQALYFFLSGYTAKVAGTERGVKEPQATFSACFGEPFLPLPPVAYAKMLGEKLKAHRPNVWLLNTGWTAGPYGVGHRLAIPHTRAMIAAALAGTIAEGTLAADPFFGLLVPSAVPGVPAEVLTPKATWANPAAYDAQAAKLAGMFRDNFKRYGGEIPEGVRNAAPRG